MNEPMNFALIGEDGTVYNIIWLCAENHSDFPNAICVSDRPVVIGDSYIDGEFLRDGEVVPVYSDNSNTTGSESEG